MSSAQTLKTVATGEEQKPVRKTILQLLEDPKMAHAMGVLAGKAMSGERMLKLCLNAVRKTPRLLQCDPQSVLGAMMTSAAIGLEPNTVQQQAFLIPYKKRMKVGREWVDGFECQFQIGYRGFITLAYRSKAVRTIQADAIHAGDLFKHELGSESFCRYGKALQERGELIGAFCYTQTGDQGEAVTVLPLEELHKIRSRSETYRSLKRAVEQAENDNERNKAEQKLADTPWVLWEDDMAAKSAIKKHAKQLPLVPILTVAGQLDDNSAAGALDLSALSDPDFAKSVAEGEEEPPALPAEAGGEPLPTGQVPQQQAQQAAQSAPAEKKPDTYTLD